MKIAAANLKAGQDAMVERNHRRIGLAVCLIAIAMMLVGLWLYIRKLES
jgi:heme/copper-type cytochrome/quinol oxidase subunit 1